MTREDFKLAFECVKNYKPLEFIHTNYADWLNYQRDLIFQRFGIPAYLIMPPLDECLSPKLAKGGTDEQPRGVVKNAAKTH